MTLLDPQNFNALEEKRPPPQNSHNCRFKPQELTPKCPQTLM